jgi:hypothetical protein
LPVTFIDAKEENSAIDYGMVFAAHCYRRAFCADIGLFCIFYDAILFNPFLF